MFVSSGIFTSATKSRLSHRATVVPWASVICATGWVVAVLLACGVEGVDVSADSVARDGVGVNTAAVNVNCEMTVLAAEVRITATSGVGSWGGFADQHAANRTVISITLMVSLSFMDFLLFSAYFTTISRNTIGPKKLPLSVFNCQYPLYSPAAEGAVNLTTNVWL